MIFKTQGKSGGVGLKEITSLLTANFSVPKDEVKGDRIGQYAVGK